MKLLPNILYVLLIGGRIVLEALQNSDEELTLEMMTPQDVVNNLTLENVERFLRSLGVEELQVESQKQIIISPTICHNPLGSEASLKLYWYQNNHIFRCYTECNEAMSIFTLYQKYMALNQHPVSFYDAVEYVKQFLNPDQIIYTQAPIVNGEDYDKYLYTNNVIQLPEYSPTILDYFTNYHHPLWLEQGITDQAMTDFRIKFSLGQNRIIIPHFDINGRLVGIRARALEKRDIEEGKYKPIKIGETLYAHQLQFNLYGIYEHKDAIRKYRSAIIAEGEKSVLLDHGYYNDWHICVACCGSHFNKYHISMLTDYLGVNEITIALDKEYVTWNDDRAKAYREKIEDMCKPFLQQATFYYIWDYHDLLNEKDSPFDKGKDIFEKLYLDRVKVR